MNTTLETLTPKIQTVGYLDQNYSFTQVPPKISATYTQTVAGTFNIVWLVAGYSYVSAGTNSSAVSVNGTISSLGLQRSVIMKSTSSFTSNYLIMNFSDYGSAEVLAGKISFDGFTVGAAIVSFGLDVPAIDPSLWQSNAGYSSGKYATVSLSNQVVAGDVLIAMPSSSSSSSDSFTISDSQGNNWTQVASNTGIRDTEIWYATATSSGYDTVNASGSNTYTNLVVYDVSGVATSGIVSSSGYCSSSCTTTLSVSQMTPPANSLVAVVVLQYGGALPDTPISSLAFSPSGFTPVEDNFQTDGMYNESWAANTALSTVATSSSAPQSWVVVAAAFPPAPSVPNAGTSSSSWSKPGLSPYESYFASESEYVSPGNGLLGIEQTDYSIAGRGLNLAITRVYAMPYAFTSRGPYEYDNYTLSNLGLGWQLNFPWMGSNYLHLSDGQVYQYSWQGSIFQNTKQTPFELVSNNGSSYDLYLSSGIDYHFNSARQLAYIADTTGNNTISFTYTSLGYISAITDTVGRNATFSYNSNNQLSAIATGEGTFYYNYSGHNLVSVEDPMGRVTRYNYATGINSWLISSITHPTGAYTEYTYSNATVGTDVTSYLVNRQDIYVSANELTKSTAFNYGVVNGLVQYSNVTVSNGNGIQSLTNYDYTHPGEEIETEVNSSVTSTVLLNDTFSGPSLDGWYYFGASGYSLGTDSSTGSPAPSAHISGDTGSGITDNGMEKNFVWSGSGSFVLSFNWRASSSYTGSSTTNAQVDVFDANTGAGLYSYQLYAGGGDTGWRNFAANISSYVQGHSDLNIYLFLVDAWSLNWNQQNWYDNIVVSTGQPAILSHVNTFNSQGGIYESDILSTSGTVLANSISQYDNWGNLIYIKSLTGQQTWFSYANTNTTNEFMFGANGFTDSFYGGSITPTTINNDTFSGPSLDGWSYFGASGYSLGTDSTTGNPAPSAHISGDTVCCPVTQDGMQKNVTWSGDGSFVLSFDWRASSSYTGSATTNAQVNVSDASTGKVLFSYQLFVGGGDTGWKSYSDNISSYVQGHGDLNIKLYLYDAWSANWDQQNWYDNMVVSAPTTPVLSVPAHSHDLLVGQASYQNTVGSSNTTETYYEYNSAGELIQQKQLKYGGWILSNFTYDSYGNQLTSTDGDGHTTYNQYSSAYDHAYLTQSSINVTAPVSAAQLSIDGSCSGRQGSSTGKSVTCKITTSKTNDLVYLAIAFPNLDSQTVTLSDSAGKLSFSSRASMKGGANIEIFTFYAVASSKLSSDTITASYTTSSESTIVAFGINGTNTTSPFDSNSAVPDTGKGNSNHLTATISTSNANDMIVGVGAQGQGGTLSATTTGFALVGDTQQTTPSINAMYDVVGSTESTQTIEMTSTIAYNWVFVADAVAAGSGSGSTMENISTTYTYDFSTGTMSYKTDPNGQTTFYSYDHLGRLTQVDYPTVNGVPAATSYTYNDTGNYVTTTDPNGNNVTNYYDGLGRLISVITYNGSSIYSEVNYTYNYLNLVSEKTTALGNTYKYSYDALGSLIKVTNPDNTTITYSYNYQNNTKTMIDENGHKTQYAYDWNNNLLWVRQWNSSTSFYQTSYSYDLAGNLLSVTDANNQVTHYSYDNLNRLISTSYPDGTTGTKTYDNVGNLISLTDAMHNTTYYSYDALNRLVNITNPDHSTVVYSYDKDGNRISKVDSATTSYYTYDARNRLANETDIINGTAYTVRYSYDRASNILSILYPDNFNLTYSYDALERVSHVGAYATFTYTKDGQIATIAYANGVNTTYTYNSRDVPTQILSVNGSTTLMDLNYKYDAVGNVISLNSQNYTYDALNRLINSTGPGPAISYTYDGAGNMMKSVQGSTVTTYTYDSYNRLLSAGNVNFTYNANGDLIKIANGSNTFQYNYDYANRVTSAIKNGVTVVHNTFDSDGKLVMETIGSSSTAFVYEGAQVIYQYNTTTAASTDRIYANGLQIARHSGSTMIYFLSDALGSIRCATTSVSAISFSTDYQPYGLTFGVTGSLEQFLFNDKLLEEDAGGIYLYGARFYDPAIERFMTEDTSTGSLEDPQSQNRYIYARDNPLSITDINGHGWFKSFTHALSNAVTKGVNTVASAASGLASDVSNAWNNLPSQDKAYVETGLIVAGVAAAVVVTGGAGAAFVPAALSEIVATTSMTSVVSSIGASVVVSTVGYDLMEGSNANMNGVTQNAVDGLVSASVSAAGQESINSGNLDYSSSPVISAAGTFAGNVAGTAVDSIDTQTSFASDLRQRASYIAAESFSSYQVAEGGAATGEEVTNSLGVDSPFATSMSEAAFAQSFVHLHSYMITQAMLTQ